MPLPSETTHQRPASSRASRALALLSLLAITGACGGASETLHDGPTPPPSPSGAGVAAPPAVQPTAGASAAPVGQAGAPAVDLPSDEGNAPTAGTTEPWCGALAVFRTACQSCHGAELAGGAPFPLVSYEDTAAPSLSNPVLTVQQQIDARVHDATRPMPPLSQPRLTSDQMAALEAWIAAGMPNATATCTGLPDAPTQVQEQAPEWPEDCEERFEIRAQQNGGPYVVPADTEQTIDISIPVPWSGGGAGPVQALAIRPLANNKRVVHHWILYSGADFITSWSPGKPMETFPQGVGVHMPSSGSFRLNMHYYNVGNPQPEPDESGLEVCITRNPRQYTATTFMFSASATVPAGSTQDNVSTCTVNAREPVHIITSSPHMHQYGVAAKLEILRADGTIQVLEDGPFNWEDQHVTAVDGVINTGDRVRVTCSYVNASDRAVSFGSTSADEMCLNFARYYPMDGFTCTGGSFL